MVGDKVGSVHHGRSTPRNAEQVEVGKIDIVQQDRKSDVFGQNLGNGAILEALVSRRHLWVMEFQEEEKH